MELEEELEVDPFLYNRLECWWTVSAVPTTGTLDPISMLSGCILP